MFDYYPAAEGDQVHMEHWSTRVPKYVPSGDIPLVPTVETARLGHLLDLLVPNGHHVMLVGPAGTGKTAIMRDKLRGLDPDAYMAYTINLNSKHDGPSLQPVLEAPLEKKAGAWGRRWRWCVRDSCAGQPSERATPRPTTTTCGSPAGMRFGPPGNKKLIYFVDDL